MAKKKKNRGFLWYRFLGVFLFFGSVLLVAESQFIDHPVVEVQHQFDRISKFVSKKTFNVDGIKGWINNLFVDRSAKQTFTETSDFSLDDNLYFPKVQKTQKEQVIKHEGYTVSYNADYCIANWVVYELTAEEVKNQRAKRSNKFIPDPQVKGATAESKDYVRSGYDRGHLAPAADMKWSYKAMRESFYLSNICPQKPKFNRGIWNELEQQCRKWAVNKKKLWIITGLCIESKMTRIGKHRVGVPRYFYKIIASSIDDRNFYCSAFLFENKTYKKSDKVNSFLTSIDTIEALSGIDFFSLLPDSQEEDLESKVNGLLWLK